MINHSELVERAVLDLAFGSVLNKEYRYKVYLQYKYHCRLRKVEPQYQIDTDYCLFNMARIKLENRLVQYTENGMDTTETKQELNAVIELIARLLGDFSGYCSRKTL